MPSLWWAARHKRVPFPGWPRRQPSLLPERRKTGGTDTARGCLPRAHSKATGGIGSRPALPRGGHSAPRFCKRSPEGRGVWEKGGGRPGASARPGAGPGRWGAARRRLAPTARHGAGATPAPFGLGVPASRAPAAGVSSGGGGTADQTDPGQARPGQAGRPGDPAGPGSGPRSGHAPPVGGPHTSLTASSRFRGSP